MNDTYEKRKSEGLCFRCGECHPEPRSLSCAACKTKHNKETRSMVMLRHDAGLCSCGSVARDNKKTVRCVCG
jgi:hypothetical protein